ncbi:hypothetical protein KIN20_026950 [Parelaphostrongylus tenuis]|uniref:protein-L-isoaspartate(D-aspartate) O-methyltransferase n=1 Tax=Parelaphostrongylus tenuis TaxID=148309 RepID=A0AAD5QYV0_PARTN|nr:hypothetical protein KIN20_026950 [Parelaphostrongylus tenuis]
MHRYLRSSLKFFDKSPYAILVQTILLITIVSASELMSSEKRVTLQQAVRVYRQIKQRATTEAPFSDFRMAWRSSGNTNEELVRNLQKGRIFTSDRVRDAMLAVDRADFARVAPYRDQPQGIGWNATISAPHSTVAALEHLKNHLVDGAYALDVGSGSGYLTVCMAIMLRRTRERITLICSTVEELFSLKVMAVKDIRLIRSTTPYMLEPQLRQYQSLLSNNWPKEGDVDTCWKGEWQSGILTSG